MQRKPMSYRSEERDDEGESNDAKHQEQAKKNLLRRARSTGVGVG